MAVVMFNLCRYRLIGIESTIRLRIRVGQQTKTNHRLPIRYVWAAPEQR